MSALPYMRMYWSDYFSATRTLNRLEHSAYLLMLGEMWEHGGTLPSDDASLARITLCTMDEWLAVKPAVIGFFRLVRGRLTQKRLAAELAKYRVTVSKRKMAGKVGSDVTNGKRKASGAAFAEHLPTKPEPEPKPEKKENAEAIWGLQPMVNGKRRSTRPDVRKAFDAAAKRADPDDILTACRAYYRLPDSTKNGGEYAMGAARLLAAERWRDFLPAPRPPGEPITADALAARLRHLRETGEWKPHWGEQPRDAA